MATVKLRLKDRVAALEAEVARLKAQVEGPKGSQQDGWEAMWGVFANDPAFEEAMRLGREYRESLRPRRRQPRKP